MGMATSVRVVFHWFVRLEVVAASFSPAGEGPEASRP